jgi:hypothetical protein
MRSAEYAKAVEQAQAFRDRFIGTVMDNTSTNMAASKRLEALNPTWICLGCVAHALNLLFKDLAKVRQQPDDQPPPAKRRREMKKDGKPKAPKVGLTARAMCCCIALGLTCHACRTHSHDDTRSGRQCTVRLLCLPMPTASAQCQSIH